MGGWSVEWKEASDPENDCRDRVASHGTELIEKESPRSTSTPLFFNAKTQRQQRRIGNQEVSIVKDSLRRRALCVFALKRRCAAPLPRAAPTKAAPRD
jgi:hypothetical protein